MPDRMSRDQRINDNWALLYAIEVAQKQAAAGGDSSCGPQVAVAFNLVGRMSLAAICTLLPARQPPRPVLHEDGRGVCGRRWDGTEWGNRMRGWQGALLQGALGWEAGVAAGRWHGGTTQGGRREEGGMARGLSGFKLREVGVSGYRLQNQQPNNEHGRKQARTAMVRDG